MDFSVSSTRTRLAIIVLVIVKNVLGQVGSSEDVSPSKIVSFKSTNNGPEGYNFSYETDDGTNRREQGEFVKGVWTVTGSVTWFSPDNQQHTMNYKADETGYRLESQSFAQGQNRPVVQVMKQPETQPVLFRTLSTGSLSSLIGVG